MKKIMPEIRQEELTITMASEITYAHVPYWYGTILRPLKMNILMPKQREERKTRRPLFVFFCGGGVQVVDKDVWLPEMVYFAKRGFIIACPEYRTYNDAVFPAQMIDAKSAIRFLKAHADEFGIDKNRVAIGGESAGGNISLCAGVYNDDPEYDVGDCLEESSAVQCVINYYGGGGERRERWYATQKQIDDGKRVGVNTIEQSLGGRPDQIPEVYEKASVLYHVKPGLPKFMFLHGTEDKLSPIELVDPLYEKLQETGNYVEYYVFPGVEHGDDRLYQPETKDMVIDFLNRNM